MSAGHTPPPWTVVDGSLVGGDGTRVLFSGHTGLALAGLPADNPNDLLLLAAPDLLEALRGLLKLVNRNDVASWLACEHPVEFANMADAVGNAQSAIAKATGASSEDRSLHGEGGR